MKNNIIIMLLALCLLALSCRSKKVITTETETKIETITTTEDTTIVTPGSKMDTTLKPLVFTPNDDGSERKTSFSKNGVNTKIVAGPTYVNLDVDMDSVVTVLEGYLKKVETITTTDKTTTKEKPSNVSINLALGLTLLVLLILYMIFKRR